MTPKPLDFEAARADLRGLVATNDAALTKTRDRLGALALDVTLGGAAQSELDAANAEHSRLGSNAEALTQALAEVDRREAAQQEKDAAAQRKRDESDLAAAVAKSKAAAAEAVELADKLAAVCTTACESDSDAYRLETRLGIHQRHGLQNDLAEMVVAKLHCLQPLPPVVLKPHREAAASRLQAVS